MNIVRHRALMVVIAVFVAAAIVLLMTLRDNEADAANHSSSLPACDSLATDGEAPPCTVNENGETFVIRDGIKYKPGPAPTAVPIPYEPQSIHADILAKAEAQGITLSLDDYEEVYPGVVHRHLPLDCSGRSPCSEGWTHRFDQGEFPEKFDSAPRMQRRGINYVQRDGVWYLDGPEQLDQPTSAPPTPTSTAP